MARFIKPRALTKIMRNKRGLSNVVATVLIVLLALAAVAIVWAFIQPLLIQSGVSATLQQKCFEVSVEAVKCTNLTTQKEPYSAVITAQLVRGNAFELLASVEAQDGQAFTNSSTAPNILGTVKIDVAGFGPANNFTIARVAAVVSDEEGNTQTCDIFDTVTCVA